MFRLLRGRKGGISEWRELKERICMRPNLTHTLNPNLKVF
jgi:hypothetical protein